MVSARLRGSWLGFTLFEQGFETVTISGIRKIGKRFSKELCL